MGSSVEGRGMWEAVKISQAKKIRMPVIKIEGKTFFEKLLRALKRCIKPAHNQGSSYKKGEKILPPQRSQRRREKILLSLPL
jgi:hypothetical protein